SILCVLNRLGNELRFVLITSTATVKPLADAGDAATTELAGLKVLVEKSGHSKCERCWHRREDVGTIAEHPDLCGRCVENIEGSGEQRQFA
uniref:zinc finger domain-containing protein n=1 Tax=Endozoicomonas sp. SESOKO1 TaxID=2828742 RepID=UPI00214750B3